MRNNRSTLTAPTLYVLKNFHAFDEFHDDRIEADALIGNEATSVLKYANTNFVSRLGGNCKKMNL